MGKNLIWTAALAVMVGCAPVISTSLQQQAGPPVNFANLQAHPENYQGRLVILGGEVISVQPSGSGSLMAIDQRDLDARLYPASAASGGTFWVQSEEWLSPSFYQPKSRVAVAGVVQGRRDGSLLIKAREIHFLEGPRWEKWYYPVPREWYDYDPNLEKWYTPPYFSPWYPDGRGR